MFEPRKKQRRSTPPSHLIVAAEKLPSGKRKRIKGTLSLDSFWEAIDAPMPKRPTG